MPLSAIPPVKLIHAGVPYTVKIVPSSERPLEVWLGNKRITFGLLKRYHPWCLQVADLDGKGQAIAVGVSKPTHNLMFPHRTFFLFSFDGHELKRKWTASTMGRPLLEFCFSPSSPQRLFTLQETLDGKVALSGYRWIGFGVTKTGAEHIWKSAGELKQKPEGLALKVNGHQVLLRWSDLLR